MTSKIEFAAQMTCKKCENAIKEKLSSVEGIHSVNVSLEKERVIVETTLPASEVQQLIESTGRRVVVKGYGENHHSAAVAMLGGLIGSSLGPVKGVVRFQQVDAEKCVIDGVIDGLSPGTHGLHVHECGDISQGCNSIGGHFNPQNTNHGGPDDDKSKRHVGDLGNIVADESGRATFRKIDNLLKVGDVVGRSVAVTEKDDDLGRGDHCLSSINGNCGTRLACGIIARSAGLFENPKRICACDGVTLWDETDKPSSDNPQQEKI